VMPSPHTANLICSTLRQALDSARWQSKAAKMRRITCVALILLSAVALMQWSSAVHAGSASARLSKLRSVQRPRPRTMPPADSIEAYPGSVDDAATRSTLASLPPITKSESFITRAAHRFTGVLKPLAPPPPPVVFAPLPTDPPAMIPGFDLKKIKFNGKEGTVYVPKLEEDPYAYDPMEAANKAADAIVDNSPNVANALAEAQKATQKVPPRPPHIYMPVLQRPAVSYDGAYQHVFPNIVTIPTEQSNH